MWPELAKAISNKLYTQGCEGGHYGEILETPTTDGLLKIAQEYEAAFGPSDLRFLLQQLVRDDYFNPGETHKRLLSLPWQDIFTTNWDTLLERTRISVSSRPYSVVRSMDSIPLAGRPRIVKLHGSFPDYFPLIFTEEDYRTYPTNFAPFVNTVQQAMMETVFCLIGFSGNDPNFLNWSGWVRDNLGDASPKIYLAGWLNLSPHKRRMLEDRNIVPIDLAHHPKAGEWPEHLRHRYATEWILHTLEQGRPYEIADWPSKKQAWKLPDIREHFQPVHELSPEYPEQEQRMGEINPEELHKHVRETLRIWIHNRKIYPDWLIIPVSVIYSLKSYTDEWEPRILQALSDFSPLDRLKALHELIWRRETLLEPISFDLESAAQETLELINCQDRIIEGINDVDIDWITVRKAWRTIGLALVTAARHHFDRRVFHQRINALSSFLEDDPNISHRIYHERCLFAIYLMDFEMLESLLKNWQVKNCDPIWIMRKASLLFEINLDDEAKQLSNIALETIREMPPDEQSFAGPSREAWALWTHIAYNQKNREYIIRDIIKIWQKLAPSKCNALLEKEAFADAIKEETQKKERIEFDLTIRKSKIIYYFGDKYNQSLNYIPQLAAHRAIRLSEMAGMPPIVDHMNVAADILKLAAYELSKTNLEMAIRLILRIEKDHTDEILTHILSRAGIAILSEKSINDLIDICNSAMDYVFFRMDDMAKNKRNLFWILKMCVIMEVISRLVLRLGTDVSESILDKALEYYQNHRFIQNGELGRPLYNLLRRSWEALPQSRRTERSFDLLSAPIAGMDSFAPDVFHEHPDPGYLLQDDFPLPRRTDNNAGQWQAILNLLAHGLQFGGQARRRAAIRIGSSAFRDRLTKDESLQIAQALWSEKYTDPNDLPGKTPFFDWVFLRLPEPKQGLAEECFRRKWLSHGDSLQKDVNNFDMIIYQVGMAMHYLRRNQDSLTIYSNEFDYIIEVLQKWSHSPVPNFQSPSKGPFWRQLDYEDVLHGLSTLITEIRIPKNIGEELYKKMQDLNETENPWLRLIPGFTKILPDKFYELVLVMKSGLSSEHKDLAVNAVQGLQFWLEITMETRSQFRKPPQELVREIGFMIAARRKVSLVQALQTAKWIFDMGSNTHRKIISNLVLQGLDYMAEELQYDREHDEDDLNEIPLRRWCSARLASSMAKRDFQDHPAISRWLKIAKQDPLPEVRYVDKTAFAHHYEKK